MGRSTGGTREHRWLAHGFLVLTRLATAGLRSRVPGGIIVDLLFALNHDSGATLILVTHDEKLAARCSRCLHMDEGKLTETSL